jgi:hypothetical protein
MFLVAVLTENCGNTADAAVAAKIAMIKPITKRFILKTVPDNLYLQSEFSNYAYMHI